MVREAADRMEVEGDQEGTTLNDQQLVVDVAVVFVRCGGKDGGVAYQVHDGGIEVAERVVFQIRIVPQGPLAAGVVIGPLVAGAGEVHPLRVAELIPDEIQITMGCGGEGEEAGQLPEGDAAVHVRVGGGQGHAGVDGGIQQAEDEGFPADDGLIMAFDITDDPFLGPAAGEFVPEGFDIPCFVRGVGAELAPEVRNPHGKAVVEAGATFLHGGGEAGHA